MTLSDDKTTEIFCLVDSFCLSFEHAIKAHVIGNPPKRKPRLSTSEVITIMILFHHSGYRTMKHFYMNHVKVHMSHLFPKTVSYNRFVELMQSANLPMAIFVHNSWKGFKCYSGEIVVNISNRFPLKTNFSHSIYIGTIGECF